MELSRVPNGLGRGGNFRRKRERLPGRAHDARSEDWQVAHVWPEEATQRGIYWVVAVCRFRCIYGLRTEPTDSRPANRFSCNGTFPVGPERSVVARAASSERKLMLVDAMSEFDASDRNCRIGKRLEAFH